MMQNKKLAITRIKFYTACFTALSFTITSIVFPSALHAAPEVSAKSVNLQDFSTLKIPEALAKVETVFDGDETAQRSVIVIQDAHSIPDAQRSIRKTILFLEKEYGAKLIGVEGASGDLDTRIFQSYPDQEKLQAVFKDYMNKGEMTGSVAAAIFGLKKEMTARGVEFFGIEDWPVYEEGLALYLAAMGEEEEILKEVEGGRSKVEGEKKAAYSPELLAVDQAEIEFEGNSKDLLAYLKTLAAIKAPEAGSEIALLLNEADKGQADDTAMDAEVRKIAAKLKLNIGKLSPEGQKTFSEKFQSFQTSQLSAAQFALALKDLSEKEGFQLPMSQGMAHQAFNQRRMRDLEGTKIFKDIEAYTKAIKESLFRNDIERQLDQRTHELILLTKWAKLELSREDWGEVKSKVEGGGWTELNGKVEGGRWRVEGQAEDTLPLQPSGFDLRPLFKYNKAFYENAEKRDEAFIRNLEKRLKPGAPAIMIAGGFHAQGLAEHLQAKGIDFALVMPNIAKLPEVSAYREHMKGNVDWKSYFEVKDGKINLYEAFVRYTRDRLLGKVEGGRSKVEGEQADPRLLKNWRDQIIRNLADEGKLAKAGEYTRFIDETLQDKKKKDIEARMQDVEKFIAGLKDLDAKGQFTAPNIANLLRLARANTASNKATTIDAVVKAPAIIVPGLLVDASAAAAAPAVDTAMVEPAVVAAAKSEVRSSKTVLEQYKEGGVSLIERQDSANLLALVLKAKKSKVPFLVVTADGNEYLVTPDRFEMSDKYGAVLIGNIDRSEAYGLTNKVGNYFTSEQVSVFFSDKQAPQNYVPPSYGASFQFEKILTDEAGRSFVLYDYYPPSQSRQIYFGIQKATQVFVSNALLAAPEILPGEPGALDLRNRDTASFLSLEFFGSLKAKDSALDAAAVEAIRSFLTSSVWPAIDSVKSTLVRRAAATAYPDARTPDYGADAISFDNLPTDAEQLRDRLVSVQAALTQVAFQHDQAGYWQQPTALRNLGATVGIAIDYLDSKLGTTAKSEVRTLESLPDPLKAKLRSMLNDVNEASSQSPGNPQLAVTLFTKFFSRESGNNPGMEFMDEWLDLQEAINKLLQAEFNDVQSPFVTAQRPISLLNFKAAMIDYKGGDFPEKMARVVGTINGLIGTARSEVRGIGMFTGIPSFRRMAGDYWGVAIAAAVFTGAYMGLGVYQGFQDNAARKELGAATEFVAIGQDAARTDFSIGTSQGEITDWTELAANLPPEELQLLKDLIEFHRYIRSFKLSTDLTLVNQRQSALSAGLKKAAEGVEESDPAMAKELKGVAYEVLSTWFNYDPAATAAEKAAGLLIQKAAEGAARSEVRVTSVQDAREALGRIIDSVPNVVEFPALGTTMTFSRVQPNLDFAKSKEGWLKSLQEADSFEKLNNFALMMWINLFSAKGRNPQLFNLSEEGLSRMAGYAELQSAIVELGRLSTELKTAALLDYSYQPINLSDYLVQETAGQAALSLDAGFNLDGITNYIPRADLVTGQLLSEGVSAFATGLTPSAKRSVEVAQQKIQSDWQEASAAEDEGESLTRQFSRQVLRTKASRDLAELYSALQQTQEIALRSKIDLAGTNRGELETLRDQIQLDLAYARDQARSDRAFAKQVDFPIIGINESLENLILGTYPHIAANQAYQASLERRLSEIENSLPSLGYSELFRIKPRSFAADFFTVASLFSDSFAVQNMKISFFQNPVLWLMRALINVIASLRAIAFVASQLPTLSGFLGTVQSALSRFVVGRYNAKALRIAPATLDKFTRSFEPVGTKIAPFDFKMPELPTPDFRILALADYGLPRSNPKFLAAQEAAQTAIRAVKEFADGLPVGDQFRGDEKGLIMVNFKALKDSIFLATLFLPKNLYTIDDVKEAQGLVNTIDYVLGILSVRPKQGAKGNGLVPSIGLFAQEGSSIASLKSKLNSARDELSRFLANSASRSEVRQTTQYEEIGAEIDALGQSLQAYDHQRPTNSFSEARFRVFDNRITSIEKKLEASKGLMRQGDVSALQSKLGQHMETLDKLASELAERQAAAAMAVDFIVKGQGDLQAVSLQVQLAGEQGIDAFADALTNAAKAQIAQLRSEVRAGSAVEDFNPEIAEFAIRRINEIFGLDPSNLKGSYGLVFNVPGEERAFSDAAKQGLNAFLTTIFSAKGVDVGLLDTGTLVQPVGSLNGLNPLAMENKNALPVVGDTPVNNPRLFLAKSEGTDTMENDPYKRVVDLYVRAIMGANVSVLVEDATRLKDASVRKQVSDTLLSKITAAKITEAVANGLFKLDSEGQLVVNRDNLFAQIMVEFQARSEVRKAA